MKRLILAALAACLLFPGLSKAQGRHEINLFIGGYNSQYASANTNFVAPYNDLYAIYEYQHTYETGPVYTLSYGYAPIRWISVGAQVNYGKVGVSTWRAVDNSWSSDKMENISVLPQVKFHIPSSRHFRLYGKLALGATLSSSLTAKQTVKAAYEWVPIGFEWAGQFFYGTAELATGTVIQGGRIGIGFRF